ncbi:hypothetical protein Sjap_025635 [Stephania japonica]|uniref:Uncharacterized protein n=1 Tax=Stephania japonica TaxID=461633 RepID=A0AAP0E9W7_9MAGN
MSNGHTPTSTAIRNEADDEDLVSSLSQKLTLTSALPTNKNCCIYRVPDNLKTANENAYVPQIVSIGPFHNGNKNLQAMQDQKWIYLKSLLSRHQSSMSNNGRSSISSPTVDLTIVQSLKLLEKRARKSYSETFDKLSSNAFVEIMILDGCFIIELFIRHRTMMQKSDGREVVDNDPLFTTPRLHSCLAWDLTLLENQLPLFVLEHLVSLIQLRDINIGQEPSTFLKELALDFFQHRSVVPKTCLGHHQKQHLDRSNHLLDLLRNSLLGSSRPSAHVTIDRAEDKQKEDRSLIPSAKELSFAGINIKKGTNDSPFNVIFKRNTRALEIPPLRIVEDLSNPLLPNLVALEQCRSDCPTSEFTSYACLMLNIMKDADGVRFLSKRGIINQLPGHDEEVVLLFKKICSGVTFPRNFHFSELYNQLNKYFHSIKADLVYILRTQYSENPWTATTIMNAAMVLFLALVQTFFTVLPYIKKHPS